MTRVVTHQLPSDKRAGFVVREVVRLYGEHRKVVVWVADSARRKALDEYLWTFEKLAFIPHVSWTESMGPVDDPVVLLGEPANPNDAEALVVADDLPPELWVASFDEVHDFCAPDDAGRERADWWQQWRADHDKDVS
jgi:DNA polymerase IIIc chi subunit